jgi:hypothetical protein
MYINYMGWDLSNPNERPFESYISGRALLSVGNTLMNALYVEDNLVRITSKTLCVRPPPTSYPDWHPGVSVGEIHMLACQQVYAHVLNVFDDDNHPARKRMDNYSSTYGPSPGGNGGQQSIEQNHRFITDVCKATGTNYVYIVAYDIVIVPPASLASLGIFTSVSDRRRGVMPALSTTGWEYANPPVGARCSSIVIRNDTIVKHHTDVICKYMSFEGSARPNEQHGVLRLQYAVELNDTYVFYCVDETEYDARIRQTTRRFTFVIFVGSPPRKTIDGSVRCIIRPSLDDTIKINAAITRPIEVQQVRPFPTSADDIDGEDDDEPTVVEQRPTEKPTVSLEEPYDSIRQKGVRSPSSNQGGRPPKRFKTTGMPGAPIPENK